MSDRSVTLMRCGTAFCPYRARVPKSTGYSSSTSTAIIPMLAFSAHEEAFQTYVNSRKLHIVRNFRRIDLIEMGRSL